MIRNSIHAELLKRLGEMKKWGREEMGSRLNN